MERHTSVPARRLSWLRRLPALAMGTGRAANPARSSGVSAAPHGTTVVPEARVHGSWRVRRAALRRTPVSMWRDDVSDWAAALTYYAILALLPAMLMAVSLIGLVSPRVTDDLIAHVTAWAPAESGNTLHGSLRHLAGERSAALTVAIGGGVSALWSASSYLAVFRRALHAQHGVEDTRPALRTAPRILLTAVTLLALLLGSALLLVLSGSLLEALGRRAGLGGAGAAAWTLLRWPALLALVALLVLVLFRTGPREVRELRHALPGGMLAALLWLTASAGFTAYASGLGAYSRLYGSLAGVVVFLVWLWVSNLALLAGAQFTAELTRAERAAQAPRDRAR
ncbi:YihY/virulence factor BrkB family protein [Streptomyces avermitilis]|uniref:YihY/virulence factor BrkB family protein n=1 Tax=Streptomyces avermitilis TaxID=33903 RepID=UPI003F4D53F1